MKTLAVGDTVCYSKNTIRGPLIDSKVVAVSKNFATLEDGTKLNRIKGVLVGSNPDFPNHWRKVDFHERAIDRVRSAFNAQGWTKHDIQSLNLLANLLEAK